MCLQVNVHFPTAEQRIIDVCQTKEQLKDLTVLDLKKKITPHCSLGGNIRLVHKSSLLEEQATLESVGIKHMSIIQTLLKLQGGSS
ncbi:uncharacterized protein V6R79_016314 [Siganus canaliculatus]